MGVAGNMSGILQSGGDGGGGAIVATGAVAGAPGTYTPAGATEPTEAELQSVTAVPASAWATSDYVPIKPSGTAYWDGSAWALGVAP
jgi:hypothetical protein